MAASVASNDSAAASTFVTGGEKEETFMQVSNSSPKEPDICLNHKNVGHEDVSDSIKGPCDNAITVQLADCEIYDQANHLEFTGLVVETVRKTQTLDGILSQSVCQTGDGAQEGDICVGSGSPGVEVCSQPMTFAESKTDTSAFACYSKEIVTVEAETSLSLEVNTELTKEVAAALITLNDFEQQCINSDQDVLKYASCDNSFSNNFRVNSTHKNTAAEQKLDHNKSEPVAKNSFGDSDIPSEVIIPNSKSACMNSTTEDLKIKSEIGHGDTLGGNKKETLDSDLSQMTSLHINSPLISEATCVHTEQDLVEINISDKKLFKIMNSSEKSAINCGESNNIQDNVNKTHAKISQEVKFIEKKHSEFIVMDTSGDRLSEKKQIIPVVILPETIIHKEKCTFIPRIHASTAENSVYNTAIPTLMTKKENHKLSTEMIVSEYDKTAQDTKLSDVVPTEEVSGFNICYSGSITVTAKTSPVGKVSETKIVNENSELRFVQEKQSLVFLEMEDSSADLDFDKQQDQELSDEKLDQEMLISRLQSDISETSIDKPVLETLTFSASKLTQNLDSKSDANIDICLCPLCDRAYTSDNKDVLAHLVLMHKFVIADVNFIANLPAYLRYWKVRFGEKPISEFCSKIVTNTGAKDQAPKEEFYLLCDALPEDKSIREHLQRKKLESVLAQQQREREETKFCRQCLFCKQTFCGNRAVLFDHLLRDHTFHVGQPDNLVYTDELFDLIQSKLDNQLCLFCEKSFKDKASLREHMRKKQHRKINPKNKEYDRFYVVNYMEMGKNWESLQSEDNRLIKSSEKDTDEEEEWSGWNEESESKVVCLFCDSSCVMQTDLQQHMKENHSFDLQEVNNRLQLNFYQKVKLINYIRRQVYHRICYGCQEAFENKEKLHSHFEEFSDHIKKIPESEEWDQPQYFFPTYEDDSLLCQLDDDDEGAAGDALGVMVIAETIPVTDTILKDQNLCHDLLKP